MSTKAKERILETKRRGYGRRMSSSDKKKFRKLRLGRLWVCRKLALEPLEEESIRVVSEPTPELKSILKPGSTFKPHGSKHDHSKKHQQKSSHDAGSRKQAKLKYTLYQRLKLLDIQVNLVYCKNMIFNFLHYVQSLIDSNDRC
ncbi:hypothetical protein O5D80_001322 [Batrachochytrium dendrobatidis]|nr:hypothetical protein O5D80_001322 [Batrachochytrium dendrobatidis]